MIQPPRFVILIPAFHMEQYIAGCLESALDQDYQHFRVLVVEDHGADGTWSAINTVLAQHSKAYRISAVISNPARIGILANHVEMLKHCHPDEIAVCLDGDDALAHPGVLEILAAHYRDPNVWMTYGSFAYDLESRGPHDPGGRGICQPLPVDDHTRLSSWGASHLKTFKVWLSRLIHDDDLRFHGEYIDPAGDVALMAPMLEMAGPEHARFVDEILYLYNARNPFNDVKIKPGWIRVMVEEIRRRKIYERLEKRP